MILYFTIGILFALFMEIVVDRVKYELLEDRLEWNSFLRILAIVFWPICSVIFVIGFIKRWNR
jgi:nitrate reductase NapE component